MRLKHVRLLRCPDCAEGVSALNHPDGLDAIDYGALACSGCGAEYPVVAGIAIMLPANARVNHMADTTADTESAGPTVSSILELVRRGELDSALASLILPPSGRAKFHRIRRIVERTGVPLASRALTRIEILAARLFRQRWHRHVVNVLTDPAASAVDAFAAYYRRPFSRELGVYFTHRFAQPRHFAGLAVAQFLNDDPRPILDLACGSAHLSHYLAESVSGRAVIGLNREFFELYVGKHFVAPAADFVCCWADQPLPFATDCFGGAICSDAFHLFAHQKDAVAEMQRVVAPDGLMVVTRVGNQLVEPNEGYERTPADYRALFGSTPNALVTEEHLLDAYLRQESVDLSLSTPEHLANSAKWLTFVATSNPAGFPAKRPITTWPHAVGVLRRNPLYVPVDDGAPDMYRFEFPSRWYAFENAGYRRYAPERVRIPASVIEHPDEHRAVANDLLRQAVILGMPERYL